jgi:anti-sigma regulatory factor (Ser/Thr protein kinase)
VLARSPSGQPRLARPPAGTPPRILPLRLGRKDSRYSFSLGTTRLGRIGGSAALTEAHRPASVVTAGRRDPRRTIRGKEVMTTGLAFEHLALLYGDAEEFAARTGAFIEAGVAAEESVLVAVPGEKIEPMRAMLNRGVESVDFLDMGELGRNPGRIIPAVREWVESRGTGRCRFIGEPIWPGRSATEVVEATRHEALINLAFADVPVTILCPYDTSGLHPSILADVERTHPQLLCGNGGFASDHYTDPLQLWRARDWPLPVPAQAPATVPISLDLTELRDFTATELHQAGVSDTRLPDLVLAVNEAATNALVHGGGAGELRIWRDGGQVVCEVADHGSFDEPLAGRRRPRPDWRSGRGVWLMNQLCDLVELRPTDTGTAVRLHVEVEG